MMQKKQSKRQQFRAKAKLDFKAIKREQSRPEQGMGQADESSRPHTLCKDFGLLYEVGKTIGTGCNGVVKRCQDRESGLELAVKVSEVRDEELIILTKHAFNNLARLNHPCIVQAVGLFISQQTRTTYLVQELVPYPTLEAVLLEGPVPEVEVRQVAESLLSAVRYIHLKGVCHRDLKPGNILWKRETGELKIVDFGVSKYFLSIKEQFTPKSMWTVTGTLAYKAPQIYRGGGYSAKVDLWAVGVILYQMAFGVLPFYNQYQLQTIQLILSQQPDYSLKEVSPLLVNLLKRLLKKDPEQRISASEAIAHPWLQAHSDFDDRMRKSYSQIESKPFEGISSMFQVNKRKERSKPCASIVRLNEIWLDTKKAESEEEEFAGQNSPS